jgi:hypothetical protein
MSNYPTLRLGVLQGIVDLKAACDAKPGFLRASDCPYDNDTVSILEKLFKPVEIEVIKEVIVEKPERGKVGRPTNKKELSEDDAAELENEAKEMLTELRQMAKKDDGALKDLDTQTKLTILKTRASLMEKLVSIRERFTSSRKVLEFQNTVVGILDDLIPEDMRDEFLKRLEPYRS